MFSYFKNLIHRYTTREPSPSAADTKQALSESLDWNLDFFRDKFDGSADLTIREMEIEGTKAAVITIEGMINKETLANAVINPIMRTFYSQEVSICFLVSSLPKAAVYIHPALRPSSSDKSS